MTSQNSKRLSFKIFIKLVFILPFICENINLVIGENFDDDSLENALEAIERRQRDLQIRENYGQPENIGYGFQKNLGFFEPGPARHLGASREVDNFDFGGAESFADNLPDKRIRSSFRERGGAPYDNMEYLQALRQLWERYQRQRGPARATDLEDLTDEELVELLNALEEDGAPTLPRGHRGDRVFDYYKPVKGAPSFGEGPYAKRTSQHLSHEQPPGDAFLYSLKWVNPAMNREGVESLRGAEPWGDDRDSDIAALLTQPRYQEGETWYREPVPMEELDYGNEQRAMRRSSYRPRDRKRSPVKRNANHAQKQSADQEVKGIFGTDKKKASEVAVKKSTVNTKKKPIKEAVKKPQEKKVVRRAEPGHPGEITKLFHVQKKSIDWSKHFGINKRMYANPFDTRVFNTKRNLVDNLDAVENRIGGVEDRILEDAVKLTGARGDEGLDSIRDGVLRRLEAAYSLEKMKAALEDFKDSVSPVAATQTPEQVTTGRSSSGSNDQDKTKRVAVKKEGVSDIDDLAFLNWQKSSSANREEACPMLEMLVDNCMSMEETLGKFAELLTPACTLHQICYTCGPEFGFSRQAACDLMFLSEAEHLCLDKPECLGGARETVLALRETHDRSPPVGTCRANPCVADHFLTSPGGVVSLDLA